MFSNFIFLGDGSQFGPEVETISTTCIEAGPGFCPFENRHGFTQDKLSGKGFVININPSLTEIITSKCSGAVHLVH